VLRQVAEGVLTHESEFLQSNAVVVQGRAGVLLIDPACLARAARPGSCGRPWHRSYGRAERRAGSTMSVTIAYTSEASRDPNRRPAN
jgi:hypothetical protein